jgi:hypothetical protein
MRYLRTISLVICLATVGGCGPGINGLSSAADSARNASESFAHNTDTANHIREAKIFADAETMDEHIQARTGAPDANPAHYEIHKDGPGDSWTVFDTANGRAVKVDSKTESGLSHDNAEALFGTLMKQDKQQDALVGRAR